MFVQYQIKNKVVKNIIIILFLIILMPLLSTLLEVVSAYGTIVGSIARYFITTNTIPF